MWCPHTRGMEAETVTRSYSTSDGRFVLYDSDEPCAYVSSTVCVELEDAR
jgi:hypothetical protein